MKPKFWHFAFTVLALLGLVMNSRAAEAAIRSKWDENLLSVELGDVRINSSLMAGAWEEMSKKYLLRANIYMDAAASSGKTTFAFAKKRATGQDLFDAFLTAFPRFTYTQDPETGVIWFHPKDVNYSEILNQKISIARRANQVPMYTDVYLPLCKLLAPDVIDSSKLAARASSIDPATGKAPIPFFWLYDVELPSGEYSAREILNFCCAASPTKAFLIRQQYSRGQGQEHKGRGRLIIFLKDLGFLNSLAPPRIEAVKFWEVEIGKPKNGTPSFEEVRAAMSDPNPKKRSAASLYVEACIKNYPTIDLIENADGADEAVWTVLGLQNALWRDSATNFFSHMMRKFPRLREDLRRIENPSLALIASLQLTREKQDTSHLDELVEAHSFVEAEIAAIKPELDRMARSSKAVREKLRAMKSRIPGLSPEDLAEMEQTNLLTSASQERD